MAINRNPLTAHLYVGCVVTLGIAAILRSAYDLYGQPGWEQCLLLAALTLLSGSVTVRIPSVGVTISVSETFVFTSVLLFGPAAGTLIAALDGLIISLWLQRYDPSLKKIIFNTAAPALSIWVAAVIFFRSAGVGPLAFTNTAVSTLLPSLVLLAGIYFLLNSWLMAWAVALDRKSSSLQIWRHDFLWLSLSFFGGASVAALIVSLNRQVTFAAIAVIVPLLIISYLTFKTAFGRIEDATQHLTQLNRLYLSTIETLAMAIDAKDQITHGHIRRVQQYAIGLARAIGVDDDAQLKAIEAAALLHDMGKLAVPEYILNKPGKLTPAEFEKMKLHASVGADILSAINFPYPVVPIVRHHHENWDGSGYPDGISGTNIPIGARVLSVVDCFDALTSDRPYRPRLTDDEALAILSDRRGSMYDPLIVDTFFAVYNQITPQHDIDREGSGFEEITRSAVANDESPERNGFTEISSSADEMLALYELAHALNGKAGLDDVGDVIAKHLRRMIPAALFVFFVADNERHELMAAYATGTGDALVHGLRIAFGQRIAGWVAVNRNTVLNSDPALDLGDSARSLKPRLRSALSTPLLKGDHIVGVMSLYSPAESAFTDDHRRIVEAVARHITDTVARSAEYENQQRSVLRDPSTGLQRFEQLGRLISMDQPLEREFNCPVSLLFVDVVNDPALASTPRRVVVLTAVDAIRKNLRAADFVFAYTETQFVVILSQTAASTATTVSERIISETASRTVRLDVASATAPEDGGTLSDLLKVAMGRASVSSGRRPGQPHIH